MGREGMKCPNRVAHEKSLRTIALDDSNKDKGYVYSGEGDAESEEVSDEELVFAGKSEARVICQTLPQE